MVLLCAVFASGCQDMIPISVELELPIGDMKSNCLLAPFILSGTVYGPEMPL